MLVAPRSKQTSIRPDNPQSPSNPDTPEPAHSQQLAPSRGSITDLIVVGVHAGVDAVGGQTGQAALAVGGAVQLLGLHEDLVDGGQRVVEHGRLDLKSDPAHEYVR